MFGRSPFFISVIDGWIFLKEVLLLLYFVLAEVAIMWVAMKTCNHWFDSQIHGFVLPRDDPKS